MWPNAQETADLVTFTEEILNEKVHFLCSGVLSFRQKSFLKTCNLRQVSVFVFPIDFISKKDYKRCSK